MQDVYCDQGLLNQLALIRVQTTRWHLFTNNVTPNRDTVLSDLIQAAWTGYATFDMATGDWAVTGITGHVAFLTASPRSFTNLSIGAVSTYGYYVTDVAGTILLKAARFDSAPVVIPILDSKAVTPQWAISSRLTTA